MNTVYILLGSNEGDRLQHLVTAFNKMRETVGMLVNESAVYRTLAWGNTEQPDFLNQVVCMQTPLSPQQLLSRLLSIEKEMGRIRGATKWMQRIIDLDILFYNNAIITEPNLHIPHPHLQDRKFVLIPLKEIASTYTHPILKKDIATLTAECKDALEVQKLIITG